MCCQKSRETFVFHVLAVKKVEPNDLSLAIETVLSILYFLVDKKISHQWNSPDAHGHNVIKPNSNVLSRFCRFCRFNHFCSAVNIL